MNYEINLAKMLTISKARFYLNKGHIEISKKQIGIPG